MHPSFPRNFIISLLSILLCLFLYQSSLAAEIKLAWDPNTEQDLAGYKIYYGTASGSYGTPINVGNVTTYILTGLTSGQTYYIAATAYDTSNNESGYSNEVNGVATDGPPIYTVTTNPSSLQIVVDGTSYIAPQTFNWTVDSSHTLSVSSPQDGSSGTRYVYSSWSDGGTQTHTITVPSSSTTYIANFITQHRLTTSVSPSVGGTVNPAGMNWYNSGQSVSISATASAGYTFSNWSGNLSGSTNPTSITMSGPKSVVANFTQNQYTLTINISPSNSGSVSKNPNKSTYVYGEQVSLTATANAGYAFSNWSGGASGSSNPITITIDGNKTVTANFTAETISTPAVPTGPAGGITGVPYTYSTGGSSSNIGHSVQYQFDWKGDGTDLSSWGSATQSKTWTAAGAFNVRSRARCSICTTVLSAWSGSISVNISPAPVSCTVTTSPSGLQMTVDGSSYTGPQTFTWTPGTSHTISVSSPQNGVSDTRYVYSSWSDGGTQTHTITVPSSSKTYTANFTTQYTLTTSVGSSGGGKVTPSGTNWYNSGQSVQISATANAGYSFSNWSGDLSGTTSPASITMNGPKNVVANFTQNQYTLTVNISPSDSGSVTKSPDKPTYVYGEQVTLTATANPNYNFSSWSGGVTGTSNPVTLTMNGNKTVTANFSVIPGNLSVTPSNGFTSTGKQGGPFDPVSQNYTLQNTGGASINWTASKGKSWISLSSSSGSLAPGASTTVTVSINGNSNILGPGSYSDLVSYVNATNSKGNTSRSVTLSVGTAIRTYTIATDPPNLQVVVDGVTCTTPQTFDWAVGSSHTLKASSPQDGASGDRYVFASWSDGNTKMVRKLTASSTTTTYTAKFTTQHKLTTSVNLSGVGTVSPTGTNLWYKHGHTLTISAKAVFGYTFSGWSGDLSGKTTPASITMDKPKNVIANFVETTEKITPPRTPTGPVAGYTGRTYSYSTGSSVSNLRHSVEYQFDWKGDGSTDISPWGPAQQSKIWTIADNYEIKVRARCTTHPHVVSAWSPVNAVSIAEKSFIQVLSPNGGENFLVGTTHTISWNLGYLKPNGNLYLFYWYDGRWHQIAADLPSTTTSYDWTIPKTPTGTNSIIPKTPVSTTSIWIGYWVGNGWECWDSSDKTFVILFDAWVLKMSGGDTGGATLWFEDETFEGYGLSLELGMFRIGGTYSIDAKRLVSGTYTLYDFEDGTTVLGRGSITGALDRSDARTLTLKLETLDGEPVFSMTGGRLAKEPAIPADWIAKITGSLNGTLDLLKIEPYQMGDEVYSHVFGFSGSGVITGGGSIEIEGNFFLTLDNLAYGIYEIKGTVSETGIFSGKLNLASGSFAFNAKSDNGKKYTFTGVAAAPQ